MKELTVREFENTTILYNNDTVENIREFSVGDFYLIQEPIEDVKPGDIITLYEVINKKSPTNIESKVTMMRII